MDANVEWTKTRTFGANKGKLQAEKLGWEKGRFSIEFFCSSIKSRRAAIAIDIQRFVSRTSSKPRNKSAEKEGRKGLREREEWE